MWPDRRVLDLFGLEHPILQAPMAGSTFAEMAIAVSAGGGLGALPCALLGLAQVREQMELIRSKTDRPYNVNFFCHRSPVADPAREERWRQRLTGYYAELGLDPAMPLASSARAAFDGAACELVEELKPAVVSFHFGLPGDDLLARVRAAGAKVVSSATTVDEARWLADRGCDAIIAQGCEAGGHRGVFLEEDVATQVGTMALVPQVVDAVDVPVIAAGGIGDARGIVAAFALGAAAVQLGTAYHFCPEARLSAPYRSALRGARDHDTALTNVFTGRPARGIVNRVMREVGPMSEAAPAFPLAGAAIAPLRAAWEAERARGLLAALGGAGGGARSRAARGRAHARAGRGGAGEVLATSPSPGRTGASRRCR